MVLSETQRPMALLGCPRGHTVAHETWPERPSLTRPGILALEPRALRERRTDRKSSESFAVPVRSSCLWFQLFRIEAFSFLPDDQTDGGDLARHGQPCHLRLHPLPQQVFVEVTKRSG